jgi:hypothetical protein
MTTEPKVLTKTELLDALRTSAKHVIDRVGGMLAEELEAGRYENGWNARQILAHVASIEWTYPKLLDIAREASGVPKAAPAAPAQPKPADTKDLPTRIAQGGILSYNDRQVEKRAEASVQDLLDEFQTNRAATIKAIEEADDALFPIEIRSAGGITGPLSNVINAVAVLHVTAHVNDITGKSN